MMVIECEMVFCIYNSDMSCKALDSFKRLGIDDLGNCMSYMPIEMNGRFLEAKKECKQRMSEPGGALTENA